MCEQKTAAITKQLPTITRILMNPKIANEIMFLGSVHSTDSISWAHCVSFISLVCNEQIDLSNKSFELVACKSNYSYLKVDNNRISLKFKCFYNVIKKEIFAVYKNFRREKSFWRLCYRRRQQEMRKQFAQWKTAWTNLTRHDKTNNCFPWDYTQN